MNIAIVIPLVPFPSGYSNAPWINPSYGKGDHALGKIYGHLIPNLRVYDVDSDTYSDFWKGGHNYRNGRR
jgi:hypothetical protein